MSRIGIYIPTRSRIESQKTFGYLPKDLKEQVSFVIDHNDRGNYEELYPEAVIMRIPKTIKNSFAGMCQYILENADEKYIGIINDDLRFEFKRTDLKIRISTPAQIRKAFGTMEKWLDSGIAHCAMAQRTFLYDRRNKDGTGYASNTRMMEALFYNREVLLSEGCAFNKNVTKGFLMADMHMNLQLLRKGYENRVSIIYVLSNSLSNAPGGASDYRTLKLQSSSSKELRKNHPKFVTLVQKEVLWTGHSEPRTDVRISWKKAYAEGCGGE